MPRKSKLASRTVMDDDDIGYDVIVAVAAKRTKAR